MKTCGKCKIEKLESEFGKGSKYKDGLRWDCKSCRKDFYNQNKERLNKRNSDNYYKNREERAAQSKIYREKNKEEISLQKKINRINNLEKHKKRARDSYAKHREKRLAKNKEMAILNKEIQRQKELEYENSLITVKYPDNYKICSKCHALKEISLFYKGSGLYNKRSCCKNCDDILKLKYEQEHKEELRYKRSQKAATEQFRIKRRTRENQRYKDNIQYNIKKKLSIRLRTYLSKWAISKKEFTMKYLGCSIEEFVKYITGKFTEGMTLEKLLNAEIHIDHIIPCNSFDLSVEENIKKCFHYTNTQPLWAEDNLSKNDKLNWKKDIDIII